MHGLYNEYDIAPSQFTSWRNGKAFISYRYENKNWDINSVAWQGTRGELYDALHNPEYLQLITFYYKWKRGLYQLPPFKEAPYYVTEAFNSFSACGG